MIIGSIRRRAELCLSRLLSQTILDRMEVVVIDLEAESPPPEGIEHGSVRYIRMQHKPSYSMAQAEGVRQARGGTIAFIEDHCYPARGWAAAILKAFREPDVSIVTYGFRNFNPEQYLSRGFFMTEYGRWATPVKRGPVSIPSCNNVAYRLEDLSPFMAELDKSFEAEFVMQRHILAGGRIAWLEPGAEVEHENWEKWSAGLACNLSHRRLNAARRAEAGGWGPVRKGSFAAALAATPLLHLGRLAASLWNRPSLWHAFFSALPVSTVVYTSTAYAEVLGCLFGAGSSREDFTSIELDCPRKSGDQPGENLL